MANSDKRFIYTDDDGNVCIVVPADNTTLTLDQIKAKDCPTGKTVYTVDKSAIPSDRSFRDAWTYTE
tara:strand:- start:180 stop:380 length:201 start_codon:yes stop_codon:yes gene_type:complete